MIKYYTYLFCLFLPFLLPINSFSQDIIYQDYFHGGVSCSGIDLFGQGGTIEGTIPIYIESESSIKKIIFIVNHFNSLTDDTLILNDEIIPLNYANDQISNTFNFQTNPPLWNNIQLSTALIDLENIIQINDSLYYITPQIVNLVSELTYASFYFVILYENPMLPKINFLYTQNMQNCGPFLDYNLNELNFIDINYDVGLTLNSSSTLYEDIDAAQIIVENDTIGLIQAGTSGDPLGSWGSAFGNSYYQNSTFYGLSDDVPNNTVNGTDAIANIQPYLSSTNSVNIEYNYYTEDQIDDQAPFSNILWQLFLTYTTTCETFEVTVPQDVELCYGESTSLEVTGGNAYEWQPQVGLSCYDCPNPTYNDTISRWYTVKINNNDTCSKTLPIHVKVNPAPAIPELSSEPTLCSDSSGVITVLDTNINYLFSLDNGTFQSENTFANLVSGDYAITAKNEYGCTSQPSLISIEEINPTQALFTATPTQGEVPLAVQFNNQSMDATDYIWNVAGDTILETDPSYLFTEPGEFSALLIAYDTYPWCSDTSSTITILTEYPFNIIIPSSYTFTMENYQIYTSRVSQLDYTLFNGVGQQVYHCRIFPVAGYSSLWQGKDFARGVYLYSIKVTGDDGIEKELIGKVIVM